MSFQVLTLLSKSSRVSRICDPDTLIGEPGTWVELVADGSIVNVGAAALSTAPKIAKVLFNGNSANQYESQDVTLGRISTFETVGARCEASADMFSGTINLGDDLFVGFGVTGAGKLKSAQVAGAGTYNIVAKAEEVHADGKVVYVLASQFKLTIAP
jgi:hypothetical protein